MPIQTRTIPSTRKDKSVGGQGPAMNTPSNMNTNPVGLKLEFVWNIEDLSLKIRKRLMKGISRM